MIPFGAAHRTWTARTGIGRFISRGALPWCAMRAMCARETKAVR
jgi:hypothetical protein